MLSPDGNKCMHDKNHTLSMYKSNTHPLVVVDWPLLDFCLGVIHVGVFIFDTCLSQYHNDTNPNF